MSEHNSWSSFASLLRVLTSAFANTAFARLGSGSSIFEAHSMGFVFTAAHRFSSRTAFPSSPRGGTGTGLSVVNRPMRPAGLPPALLTSCAGCSAVSMQNDARWLLDLPVAAAADRSSVTDLVPICAVAVALRRCPSRCLRNAVSSRLSLLAVRNNLQRNQLARFCPETA